MNNQEHIETLKLQTGALTPKQIVAELDKYIIGQQEAKKNVAIALRNRWRRMNVTSEIQGEIVPNNILMIGPTGVGKTEIARRLAKIADAPFTKVEASKFTEVGYVGRDVESMVRDLVEQSVNLVKTRKKEEVMEKASQVVEDLILDALIPPLKSGGSRAPGFNQTEIQEPQNDQELNERTRERFREKIRNGELEDRKIEINIKQSSNSGIGMIGGGMIDEASMINLQDMIGNMMPKKNKKRKVTIAEARKLLLEEEASKLIDMDEVKEEAISKAENTGIIFIDEIDKITARAEKGGGKGPDVSREGVQRDLLPIVEGSTVTTKHGIVNTDHILFIAAGAFHFAKPSDLIPELQGRFPIRVELNNLTKEDFVKILKEPKNALTKQYTALFKSEEVELTFQEDAVDEIAEKAFQINSEIENIGARRLQTVMSQLLNDFLYDVPDVIGPNAKLVINKELVEERLAHLVKNRDLSQYIL
ncbi:MAG: ATP-dependent protease ATPase subunit HslU [Cyclobacteriaceae bacterium]